MQTQALSILTLSIFVSSTWGAPLARNRLKLPTESQMKTLFAFVPFLSVLNSLSDKYRENESQLFTESAKTCFAATEKKSELVFLNSILASILYSEKRDDFIEDMSFSTWNDLIDDVIPEKVAEMEQYLNFIEIIRQQSSQPDMSQIIEESLKVIEEKFDRESSESCNVNATLLVTNAGCSCAFILGEIQNNKQLFESYLKIIRNMPTEPVFDDFQSLWSRACENDDDDVFTKFDYRSETAIGDDENPQVQAYYEELIVRRDYLHLEKRVQRVKNILKGLIPAFTVASAISYLHST